MPAVAMKKQQPGQSRTADQPDPRSGSQTDWSMIFEAAGSEGAEAQEAWDQLSRRYWPAIYAYIRSTGRDVEDAADLTQGFVCDVLLGRRLFAVADPRRGRFRTLLLTALKNYLTERHRYDTRKKRSPRGDSSANGDGPKLLELDRESPSVVARSHSPTPDAAFDTQWAVALVHRILDGVRAECVREELAAHWTVFERRVVRPMLTGEPPIDYSVLVDRLDLKDAAQAANMMITVKRRFARAMYAEIGRTVKDPDEIEEEISSLMRALQRTEGRP
ncbi:MAG: sigma-70 family RNA polymerase sigma factor [Planctomycetes bacterium]|nr:sigma-70 family RNA polymerase sigma factor [Planctomycetota bacterium]